MLLIYAIAFRMFKSYSRPFFFLFSSKLIDRLGQLFHTLFNTALSAPLKFHCFGGCTKNCCRVRNRQFKLLASYLPARLQLIHSSGAILTRHTVPPSTHHNLLQNWANPANTSPITVGAISIIPAADPIFLNGRRKNIHLAFFFKGRVQWNI